MSIRTYEEGDEDEIAGLLSECFGSLKSSNLTGEKWLKIFEFDTGYRKDLAFVAEKDGKIVSHVQLVVRDIKVGSGATLKVAGIANVSTLKKYRRDGMSTKLLVHAVETAKEQGFSSTALFTGAQIPAHRIYLRLGLTDVYFPVLLLRGAKAPHDLRDNQAKLASPERKVEIRESDEDDDSSILKVYEENYSAYNGLVVRDMNTWKSKFRKLLVYECPFYEEEPKPSNILVAERENEGIVGYAISSLAERDKLGHVCELLTVSGREFEAGRPLAERVLLNLSEEKPLSNIVYSSKETLIDRLFRKGSSPLEGVSVFMHKTLDFEAILESSFRSYSSADGRRLQNLWDSKLAIAIRIADEEVATAKCEGQSISILRGEESKEKVTFADYDSFAMLLYGARGFTELMNENKIKLSLHDLTPGKVTELFDSLYPKKPILTCPGDWW